MPQGTQPGGVLAFDFWAVVVRVFVLEPLFAVLSVVEDDEGEEQYGEDDYKYNLHPELPFIFCVVSVLPNDVAGLGRLFEFDSVTQDGLEVFIDILEVIAAFPGQFVVL